MRTLILASDVMCQLMPINPHFHPTSGGPKNLPKGPRSETIGKRFRGNIMCINMSGLSNKSKKQYGYLKKVNGTSLLSI